MQFGVLRASAAAFCLASLGLAEAPAQQPDNAAVVRSIDAAVKARLDGIAGYTVIEHYAVFRNQDEVHPVAEMTVKTTYRRDTGKSYEIQSQSGSEMIRKLVLSAILDNEKNVNEPGVREGAWLTSANYEMKLKQPATESVNGKDCYVLELTPRRKAPFLLQGTLWVDAKDGSIVQIQGTASKSSSVFTGPTQMKRQYAKVGEFAQGIHARAQSDSFLFGQTVVTIDYRDYQIQLRTP
jgi:outer membrane lipoprotein-sorting protein